MTGPAPEGPNATLLPPAPPPPPLFPIGLFTGQPLDWPIQPQLLRNRGHFERAYGTEERFFFHHLSKITEAGRGPFVGHKLGKEM